MDQLWVADAHCDFLYGMVNQRYNMLSPQRAQQISLKTLQKGGVKLQYFAAWMDHKLKIPFFDQFLLMFSSYRRLMRTGNFAPFTKDFDLDAGTVAGVLSVEGGEAIEGDLENLRILAKLGVKAMALTWNYKNELACPAMGKDSGGLSVFGISAVKEMNRLGIAVDVSHLNDAGIRGVFDCSSRPFMASHSNARALCEHPRNLTDEQLKRLISSNCFIGVSLYAPHLRNGGGASVYDAARHIAHIASLGGVKNVGIGADFDGMGDTIMRDVPDCSYYPMLRKALAEFGFSEDELDRIMALNLIEFTSQFV